MKCIILSVCIHFPKCGVINLISSLSQVILYLHFPSKLYMHSLCFQLCYYASLFISMRFYSLIPLVTNTCITSSSPLTPHMPTCVHTL